MTAAVVDVGSNTVRLLVGDDLSRPRYEDGVHLGLGERVAQHGRLGDEAIEEAADVAAQLVEAARSEAAERIAVLVTAPGRFAADGEELLERLRRRTGIAARIVAEDEEARLVFAGAAASSPDARDPIAVCDVGGGSTELAVGTRGDGALWLRSLPVGSANPPAGDFLAGLSPPPVASALASGGTAKALARLVGDRLDDATLERARKLLAEGKTADLPPERVAVLPAGATIFVAIHRLLGIPLHVSPGGFREGALLGLL